MSLSALPSVRAAKPPAAFPARERPMASVTQPQLITQRMKSNDTRARGPRRNNGGRRRPPYRDSDNRREQRAEPPRKVSFWHTLLAFFGAGPAKKTSPSSRTDQTRPQGDRSPGNRRRAAPPERVEVTSPRQIGRAHV